MICVTIEMVPFGDESAKRTVAELRIGNVSNLSAVSSYRVEPTVDGVPGAPFLLHHHHREDGWEPLVGRAIETLHHRAKRKGSAA